MAGSFGGRPFGGMDKKKTPKPESELDVALEDLSAMAKALQGLLTYHSPSPDTTGIWKDLAGMWASRVRAVETAIVRHRLVKAAEARQHFSNLVEKFWEGKELLPRPANLDELGSSDLFERWRAPDDLASNPPKLECE